MSYTEYANGFLGKSNSSNSYLFLWTRPDKIFLVKFFKEQLELQLTRDVIITSNARLEILVKIYSNVF